MTKEEAIKILDPASSAQALSEIAYYAGFSKEDKISEAIADACRIALDALRSSKEQNASDAWIRVSDKLPKEETPVLVCYRGQGRVEMVVSERFGNIWYGLWGREPEFWMEIPEIPQMCCDICNAEQGEDGSLVIGIAGSDECPYCALWDSDECDGNPDYRMKAFGDCPLQKTY